MEKILRLDSQQRSNLVAYLDGELSERECQEIEQVLARSEVARHDVDILARAYDALDLLPPVRASDEFTRKTVTALRIAVPHRVGVPKLHWTPTASRGVMYAGWGAAIVLWACCGFLFTKNWIPNDADKLLRDFPIADKLDALREADSLEFLLELQRQGAFNDSGSVEIPSGQLSLDGRRKRIAHMPASERERLTNKFAEFERLPEEERTRIRQLELALSKEDDSRESKLRQIMDDYQVWLATQTEAQRTEIEKSADPAVRARNVSKLRKPAASDGLSISGERREQKLSSADLKSALDALEEIARKELERDQLKILDETEGLEHFAQLLVLLTTNPELKYRFMVEKDLYDAMVRAVSNTEQRKFLQSHGRMKPWLLADLIRRGIQEQNATMVPDAVALEELFNSLEPDARDRIMSFEPLKQPEELTRLFKERHPEKYLSPATIQLLWRFNPMPDPNGRYRRDGEAAPPDRGPKDRLPLRDGGAMKRRGERGDDLPRRP